MRLYRLILALVLPLLLARLGARVLAGKEAAGTLGERLGFGAATEPGAIWLHAASNGELVSARPLIAAMLARAPGLRFLITVNTVTARALAADWAQEPALSGHLAVRMAPLDSRGCLGRFFARHAPAALIVIENEIWPNRLTMAGERAIPVLIAGGRMSARSARRWRKIGLGPVLAPAIAAVSAQDEASAAGFRGFGVPAGRMLATVNLKTAVAPPAATWSPGWARALTVLAASTHEGEDAIVLDAFLAARRQIPGLRLILAPRHPRRAPAIARLIAERGLSIALRSAGDDTSAADVLLADTMGEMANWYRAASVCFVGGTLVDKGGHTPFEPVSCGCAIVHGPFTANHRAPFGALDAAGAAVAAGDADALGRAFAMGGAEASRLALRAGEVLAPMTGHAAIEGLAAAFLGIIGAKTGTGRTG